MIKHHHRYTVILVHAVDQIFGRRISVLIRVRLFHRLNYQ